MEGSYTLLQTRRLRRRGEGVEANVSEIQMSNLLCKQTIPEAKAIAEICWLNKPGIPQRPGKQWDKFPVPISVSNGFGSIPILTSPLVPIPPIKSLIKLIFWEEAPSLSQFLSSQLAKVYSLIFTAKNAQQTLVSLYNPIPVCTLFPSLAFPRGTLPQIPIQTAQGLLRGPASLCDSLHALCCYISAL